MDATPDFAVDAAVGTTYSLDLTALLLPPLSFALFDQSSTDSLVDPDSRLLEVELGVGAAWLGSEAELVKQPDQPSIGRADSGVPGASSVGPSAAVGASARPQARPASAALALGSRSAARSRQGSPPAAGDAAGRPGP